MVEVNQSKKVSIRAKDKWTNTGIRVLAGEEYHCKAEGEWHDLHIPCDANGYDRWWLRPFQWMRRAPGANWFALMGAIDQDQKTLFLIGKEQTILIKQSGVLMCFANDIAWMYWNNWGSVQLTITRVR